MKNKSSIRDVLFCGKGVTGGERREQTDGQGAGELGFDMTQMVDEQLERRLVEHLDGELSETEQVDLYRELLRNRQLRATLDRYAETDRIAGEALRAVIDAPRRPVRVAPRKRHVPWAQLLATAALFLAAVGVWGVVRMVMPMLHDAADPTPRHVAVDPGAAPQTPDVTGSDGAGGLGAELAGDPLIDASADAQAQPWWRNRPSAVESGYLVDTAEAAPIIDGAQHGRRSNDRALIGVLDEDAERFYWFEVDHQQTVVESVAGEL
jgi:hypothetical protein